MKRKPSAEKRPSLAADSLRVGLGLAVAGGALWLAWTVHEPPDVPAPPATPPAPLRFVGSQACAECHPEAVAAWRGSQHARAMAVAGPETVRADFDETESTHAGVRSRFFRRDGDYFVNTEGPDGRSADFRVAYAFGVEPLQQYLIEWPGGRLQAFGVAWDTRPARAGGQRWFSLYPDRNLAPGDPLHWTGIDQNWNYQCADCHATNVRKNYDESERRFDTTWSELGVGCEACHGPASTHVAWAEGAAERGAKRAAEGGDDAADGSPADGAASDPGARLPAALCPIASPRWTLEPGAATARRAGPHDPREVEVCARCHARREQFSDDFMAGRPLHDAFRPALLVPGLYHADGQQLDEVFDYGSFLQSRMYAEGVRCSDCHEPHSGALRAEGNAVCGACHRADQFDTPDHTHHPAGSAGATCAACHMPTTTYMVVDPRHDHGFRIPRPDRTPSLGTPNACAGCHAGEGAAWAAKQVAAWLPAPKPGFQGFAEAFHAAEAREPGARGRLVAIARDSREAPIVRASALARLAARGPTPRSLEAARLALSDADADVRVAAVEVLAGADDDTRLALLPDRLRDPSRVVRMDAARSLAGAAESRIPTSVRADFDRALAEWVAAQRFNADRPEAQTNLGGLALAQGRVDEAKRAFERALELDPTFLGAALNLADAFRAEGDEKRAESTLRTALRLAPDDAALQHALGLALVRQQRIPEALDALATAARAEPANPRFAFVHAVALHDTGAPERAIDALREAHSMDPDDADVLGLLAAYEREIGRIEQAARHEQALDALQRNE